MRDKDGKLGESGEKRSGGTTYGSERHKTSAKLSHTGESVCRSSYVDVALPELVVEVIREWICPRLAFPQFCIVSWVRIPRVRLEVCEAAIDFPMRQRQPGRLLLGGLQRCQL